MSSDLLALCRKVRRKEELTLTELQQVLDAARAAGFDPEGTPEGFCSNILRHTWSFLERQSECGLIAKQASYLDPFEWLDFSTSSKRVRECLLRQVDEDGTPLLEVKKREAAKLMREMRDFEYAPVVSRAGLRKAAKAGVPQHRLMEIAARNGYVVKALVEQGADYWIAGLRGAARGGHRSLVNFFIAKGAKKLKEWIARGVRPPWNEMLAAAARGGHRSLVDFFIAKGADNWETGLMEAARGGHRSLVDFFIPKVTDELDEQTWLQPWQKAMVFENGMFEAARGGHRSLVDFFISKGARLWDSGLENAARGGHRSLVDFFIAKGITPSQTSNGLLGAARGGHRSLVDFFVSKYGDKWNKDHWNGAMFQAARGGHRSLVEFFIAKGADDYDRGLWEAAYGGNLSIVGLFVAKGADARALLSEAVKAEKDPRPNNPLAVWQPQLSKYLRKLIN